MFQIERLQLIKQILSEKKSVDVMWLSGQLEVSEVTIRRDLEKLETEGFLKRTYGGAILNESSHRTRKELPAAENGKSDISERGRGFGKIEAAIVENHDIIFLGRGEANEAMTDYLEEKEGIVIFTNSLSVLNNMNKYRKHKVISIGGEANYDKGILCCQGSSIPFPDIRVNKAFLYVQGMDLDYGISINDQEDAYIYREMKKRSRHVVAVMEGSVFGKIGLNRVDETVGADYVVTDDGIPDIYKQFFYKNGVQLHQKFDF